MATVGECEAALHEVAARLARMDPDLRQAHAVDRTWSCRVPDIDADFSGHIEGGGIASIIGSPNRDAQVKLTVKSDDLVALTRGDVDVASLFAWGRLKIDASVFDLLKLRSML